MRKEIDDLWNLVEPTVVGAGFELVELLWGREGGGWALRVFIDRPFGPDDAPRLPGSDRPSALFQPVSVGHEDCERVSRDLSAVLDVADRIAHTYRLEVSSPGLERPLRRERDFRRFAGQSVKVRTVDAVEGRRNFSGVLRGAEGGAAIVACDGQECRVPIDKIARAHLVPDWDAEFGWTASGQRADDLDGRETRTVRYEKEGKQVGYTIVPGDALDPPEDASEVTSGGVDLELFTQDGRRVVTWLRDGKTCVLSGAEVDDATLVKLAVWKGDGAVEF